MPATKTPQDSESPESQIKPYAGLSELQRKITGEKLPNIVLEICDNCNWCATCINRRGIRATCPICKMPTSEIAMALDEVCIFEVDEKRGVTLRFERRLPLR